MHSFDDTKTPMKQRTFHVVDEDRQHHHHLPSYWHADDLVQQLDG
jgi:hypothetical protein